MTGYCQQKPRIGLTKSRDLVDHYIHRSAIGQVRALPESDYRGDSIHVVPLFDLTAGVYNLFDKTVDYSSYGTVLDGRRYNLGVTYNF